mgnify:CR=1 FL=1
MEMDLAFVWAMLIAFAVFAYVVLDGFDLGIGILFPFLVDRRDRDVAMNSVAPVLGGIETLRLLLGGGLPEVAVCWPYSRSPTPSFSRHFMPRPSPCWRG